MHATQPFFNGQKRLGHIGELAPQQMYFRPHDLLTSGDGTPEAMSSDPRPHRHEWRPGLPYSNIYTDWTKPPKDYGKWSELACQWAKHSVDKYGAGEVNTWWWDVWNEANNQSKAY